MHGTPLNVFLVPAYFTDMYSSFTRLPRRHGAENPGYIYIYMGMVEKSRLEETTALIWVLACTRNTTQGDIHFLQSSKGNKEETSSQHKPLEEKKSTSQHPYLPWHVSPPAAPLVAWLCATSSHPRSRFAWPLSFGLVDLVDLVDHFRLASGVHKLQKLLHFDNQAGSAAHDTAPPFTFLREHSSTSPLRGHPYLSTGRNGAAATAAVAARTRIL